MPNKFDSKGLQIETRTETLNKNIRIFKEAYGNDINLESNSPDGQLLQIITQAETDMLEKFISISSSRSLMTATNQHLDDRASLLGLTRVLEESDLTFRIRILKTIFKRPVNFLEEMESQLKEIRGIFDAKIFLNRTREDDDSVPLSENIHSLTKNSMAVVIRNGIVEGDGFAEFGPSETGSTRKFAAIVLNNKPVGISTNGTDIGYGADLTGRSYGYKYQLATEEKLSVFFRARNSSDSMIRTSPLGFKEPLLKIGAGVSRQSLIENVRQENSLVDPKTYYVDNMIQTNMRKQHVNFSIDFVKSPTSGNNSFKIRTRRGGGTVDGIVHESGAITTTNSLSAVETAITEALRALHITRNVLISNFISDRFVAGGSGIASIYISFTLEFDNTTPEDILYPITIVPFLDSGTLSPKSRSLTIIESKIETCFSPRYLSNYFKLSRFLKDDLEDLNNDNIFPYTEKNKNQDSTIFFDSGRLYITTGLIRSRINKFIRDDNVLIKKYDTTNPEAGVLETIDVLLSESTDTEGTT